MASSISHMILEWAKLLGTSIVHMETTRLFPPRRFCMPRKSSKNRVSVEKKKKKNRLSLWRCAAIWWDRSPEILQTGENTLFLD